MSEPNGGFELTEEHVAKIEQCSTPEELAALAQEEGVELTDEQLEGISGGWGKSAFPKKCPRCESSKIRYFMGPAGLIVCDCDNCHYHWETHILA